MYLWSMLEKPSGLTLSKGNPFSLIVQEQLSLARKSTRISHDNVSRQRVTVTVETEYLPTGFTKLYHNREVLDNLSPWACKILMYIALHVEYESEKIQLSPTLVKIDKRKFSSSIKELIGREILAKEKREWYWINVTLLIVGNLSRK